MKKIICAALLILSGFGAFAQPKVVDKSGRKPDWVNGLEKEFIIVVGSGSTIDMAQNSALMLIKQNIVLSVADNVKAKSELKKEESSYNNSVSTFLEKYTSQVSSESGKVSYLQGVSLSNASEYYWEKQYDKSNKQTKYYYHIKYPFSEFEMKKLVSDFRMRDREMTENLDRLEAEAEIVTSIEEMEKNLSELKTLQEAFIDARKDKVNMVMARYQSILQSVELVEVDNSIGSLKFTLRLGNRTISTVKKPLVKSDCARINGTKNNVSDWEISYDYDNCYEDPENNILVSYRFGNANVSKKFFFDVAAKKAKMYVSEAVRFTKVDEDADNILSSSCSLTLIFKYDAPIIIEKVTLELQGVAPMIFEGINQSFSGKGNHDLKLNIATPLPKMVTTATGKSNPVLSGTIQYKNQTSGESLTYRLYNQKYSTNW
ncbi:hypothetical protein [Williamwhitmania taraxaci]|uniref:Plethodontid receptivity factor PRF n=1 Tax=Williamwhitmania taraxaci TaxID=1640674 RepID=A0A1G6SA21_9BACT|nr:hypothetical protein [Williamwhitmania taraxaci]SDD13762.1 hypothetical protein SAMN05216323_109012 [Williamwhitmania taraxaci]